MKAWAQRNTGRRRIYIWLALALAALLIVWRLFFAGGPARPGMSMDAPPVRVATAVAQDVPHFLNGLGTVTPSSDVLVKSRVDGQLVRLHFQEGQRVKAGELLAEIDPRPFQAVLDEAQGNLAKDQAQLDNARRIVLAQGKSVELTYKEYELLRYLMINAEMVLSRESIMRFVWGTEFEGETRTVDMHIKTLRQKLGP